MADDDLERRAQRLERLRRLGLQKGARDLPRPVRPQPPALEAGVLPGEPVMTPVGPAWVRTARFPLDEHPEIAAFLQASPAALAAAGRDPALAALDPGRAAFVDTETTGLSPGAGAYTFLIGVGEYELDSSGGAFVVRQFFMRSPAEEAAQLLLAEEALGRSAGLVTFNGRAFDVPLITTRFILARMPVSFARLPHLDLLPPARRVWRARWQSCRLGNLEQNVLGVQRTLEDVPGWMIPDIYRDYYRTGVATEMLAHVFYHNLQDIVSMALLGARLAELFRADRLGEALAGLHPLETLSLARCYEALEWHEAGIEAYRAAQAGFTLEAERAAVLRDLGLLYKRLGRHEDAAAVWEEWLASVAGDDLTPYVELAKHHEWRTGDLAAARGWAAWALHLAEGGSPGPLRDIEVADLRHRLARLERKLSGAATEDAPE
jgi:uncharacterized protein YprB with RNaseH-like and TPR domain